MLGILASIFILSSIIVIIIETITIEINALSFTLIEIIRIIREIVAIVKAVTIVEIVEIAIIVTIERETITSRAKMRRIIRM